jgi:hypothetical protein
VQEVVSSNLTSPTIFRKIPPAFRAGWKIPRICAGKKNRQGGFVKIAERNFSVYRFFNIAGAQLFSNNAEQDARE